MKERERSDSKRRDRERRDRGFDRGETDKRGEGFYPI